MIGSQGIRFDFHALFHCEGLSSFSSFLLTLICVFFALPSVLLAWKGAAAFGSKGHFAPIQPIIIIIIFHINNNNNNNNNTRYLDN